MSTDRPRLSRRALAEAGRPQVLPPARIVHLGVGAFHRAHQAWYTARSADADRWGITAFTGRSSAVAERLDPQDGLYTLVERGPDGDRHELIGSIVRVLPGEKVSRLTAVLAAPETAVVTLTITEAGYRLAPDGTPDPADPVLAADLDLLSAGLGGPRAAELRPETALARLLLGLEARRVAGAPPLAIVSCDNLPDNGGHLRRGLTELAARCAPATAAWLADEVAWVSSSVDRITPRTQETDLEQVAEATGWFDAAPVITEPFSDWVLCGEFPSGRPDWESAGARIVTDVEPFETRKLWLLNGSHSLLAAAGQLRGCYTVAEAITDPVCRQAVEQFWDEAERHLPGEGLDLTAYRQALLDRFTNPRIEHRLEQIAIDGLTKLQVRIVPVAQRERAAGRPADGCARAVGAWLVAAQRGLVPAPAGPADQPIDRLPLVSPALAEDPSFMAAVGAAVRSFS